MPSATMPTITNCNDSWNPIPDGMECGDDWYTAEEWAEVRLSSKNHVDAPILIPQEDGTTETIHLTYVSPNATNF